MDAGGFCGGGNWDLSVGASDGGGSGLCRNEGCGGRFCVCGEMWTEIVSLDLWGIEWDCESLVLVFFNIVGRVGEMGWGECFLGEGRVVCGWFSDGIECW